MGASLYVIILSHLVKVDLRPFIVKVYLRPFIIKGRDAPIHTSITHTYKGRDVPIHTFTITITFTINGRKSTFTG